ncbi:hypothetical protein VTJ83DRAFT_126 [Remersonia thermophila]|uniref:Uncharacterized protein n=1 Tax=Remersonia thermophila TaxID=72144 RepID=A0ABR4DK50_9PEZI
MAATVVTGQAPTNLGPLTTTFTPPPACTVAVGAGPGGAFGSADKSVGLLGQRCSAGRAWDATSCWPETSQGAPEAAKQAPLRGWGYYSPGLHCPAGYATACSATGGAGGETGWPVQFVLGAGETAVGCCPSGYGCANMHGQTCTMVAASTAIPTVTCHGSKSGNFGYLTIPGEGGASSLTALTLLAPMIQINWRATDRPGATTTAEPTATSISGSQGPSASGTKTVDAAAASGEATLVLAPGDGRGTSRLDPNAGGTSSSSRQPASDDKNENGDTGGGLDAFSGVAIGAASTAVLLAVVVCGLFFWWWRRRTSKREERDPSRLYGMRHAMSPVGGLAIQDDMPGWYRGQRQATLPNQYSGASGWAPSMRSIDRPAAPAMPYYRPYRPSCSSVGGDMR